MALDFAVGDTVGFNYLIPRSRLQTGSAVKTETGKARGEVIHIAGNYLVISACVRGRFRKFQIAKDDVIENLGRSTLD